MDRVFQKEELGKVHFPENQIEEHANSLKTAVQLLSGSNKTILGISDEIGISDMKNFRNLF